VYGPLRSGGEVPDVALKVRQVSITRIAHGLFLVMRTKIFAHKIAVLIQVCTGSLPVNQVHQHKDYNNFHDKQQRLKRGCEVM